MVPIKKILGAAKDDHAGGRPQERSIATTSRCFLGGGAFVPVAPQASVPSIGLLCLRAACLLPAY
jgi:hypothetical protein